MELSDRLKAVMLERGVKVKDLAALTDVPEQTIFALLNGKTRNPRMETMAPIARVLAADLLWLWYGVSSDPPAAESADDCVMIPFYNVKFGAGGEPEPTWEEAHDAEPRPFKRSTFREASADPANCRCVRVQGDSMEPTINDGDSVVIDCGTFEHIIDGKVYAFVDPDNGLRIKRLRRKSRSLIVHSDNPQYSDEIIEGEDMNRLKIVGRVISRSGKVY